MKEHKVYHIHYGINPDLMQGYIGVTGDLKARIRQHKASGVLRKGDSVSVLYEGTREECLALELKLRPSNGIGRNISHGGAVNCTAIKPSQHLSRETEIKPGERLSKQTEFKPGQQPHNKGKGKDYIFTSPDGEEYYVSCISDFCKAHNLTPANMRKVAKGERNFHKGWKAIQAGR